MEGGPDPHPGLGPPCRPRGLGAGLHDGEGLAQPEPAMKTDGAERGVTEIEHSFTENEPRSTDEPNDW